MPPSMIPRTTEIPITTKVRFRVVSRSGQLTFFASEYVSRAIRRIPF